MPVTHPPVFDATLARRTRRTRRTRLARRAPLALVPAAALLLAGCAAGTAAGAT